MEAKCGSYSCRGPALEEQIVVEIPPVNKGRQHTVLHKPAASYFVRGPFISGPDLIQYLVKYGGQLQEGELIKGSLCFVFPKLLT